MRYLPLTVEFSVCPNPEVHLKIVLEIVVPRLAVVHDQIKLGTYMYMYLHRRFELEPQ